jgi:hypothetical protein
MLFKRAWDWTWVYIISKQHTGSDRHGFTAGIFRVPVPVPAKTHTRSRGSGISAGLGAGCWRVGGYMTRRGCAAGLSHFYIQLHILSNKMNMGERIRSPAHPLTLCCPCLPLSCPLPLHLSPHPCARCYLLPSLATAAPRWWRGCFWSGRRVCVVCLLAWYVLASLWDRWGCWGGSGGGRKEVLVGRCHEVTRPVTCVVGWVGLVGPRVGIV